MYVLNPFVRSSTARYQFIIVYFIAGLKKYCDMDWMYGYSMGKLAKHWVFSPFTAVIPMEVVNFAIVHSEFSRQLITTSLSW